MLAGGGKLKSGAGPSMKKRKEKNYAGSQKPLPTIIKEKKPL